MQSSFFSFSSSPVVSQNPDPFAEALNGPPSADIHLLAADLGQDELLVSESRALFWRDCDFRDGEEFGPILHVR